jgi:hypothetical protein
VSGACSIGKSRHPYKATRTEFRYQPEAGGAVVAVPAGNIAVVRVMPMEGSGPFVMFGGSMDADHVFLSMTFWGKNAVENAVDVGSLLDAQVFVVQ